MTSLYDTSQQWDAPNAWAPLQYFMVEALRTYGGSVSQAKRYVPSRPTVSHTMHALCHLLQSHIQARLQGLSAIFHPGKNVINIIAESTHVR